MNTGTGIYWNGRLVELLKVDHTEDGSWAVSYRYIGDGPEVERNITADSLATLIDWAIGAEEVPDE